MPPADLERKVEKLSAILEVAKAFSTQHSLDSLLDLVLREAAKVVEADRCSIFLVDRIKNELWTRAAQGTGTIRIPWGTGIVGAVAKTGDTVILDDAYSDPRFNRGVDQATGYHTRNMLCVPMKDARGAITGVLQALNRLGGGPFTQEDTEYLIAIGGQAAAAIENASLHRENQELLQGFVDAAVVAIESRDPTTHGHSQRVAALTTGLAEVVNKESHGPYSEIHFKPEQMEELRLAALLHDFGKVGVREHVLVKANKLFAHELDLVRSRFDFVRRTLEMESWRRRAEALSSGSGSLSEQEEARLAAEIRDLEEVYEFLLQCNKPTVLSQGGFERLTDLAKRTYADLQGQVRPLVTPIEVEALSIPKGSLTEDERREIESHVTWTYRFLAQIPWTRTLRRVPDIAYAHHEKLDGRGYPRKLGPDTIPVESRIMTVADIYDALTASDRPYKKAVPKAKAFDILKMESDAGQLDGELFRLFIESDVPRKILGHDR